MRRLDQISDDELEAADGIQTYDPVTMKGYLLWGKEFVEPSTQPGSPARLKMVDIRVHADDIAGLLSAINRVEQLKGQLPLATQTLRDNLTN